MMIVLTAHHDMNIAGSLAAVEGDTSPWTHTAERGGD